MGQEVKVTGPGKLGGGASDTTPRTLFFTISPTLATISVGASQQLTSRLQDASGNLIPGQPVTWGSTNPNVAAVGGTGIVTGMAPGSTTISASSLGQGANASITVDLIPVASVAVTPRLDTLQVGFTGQLTAAPYDAIGNPLTGRVVSWASDNRAVATVNGGGLVTAVAVGTANVTATVEGVVGTGTITVLFIPVASVQVTPPQDSIPLGGSRTFTATPRDALGNPLTGRAVAWGTNDPAVATVSGSGVVSGTGLGTTTITATSEGQTGSATVKVILTPVAAVQVTPATATVVIGLTRQLTATTRDASGGTLTGRVVTWASGNPAAATVDGTGLVTAVALGSSVITATSEGKNGTATITVTNPPPTLVRVILTPNPASVVVGRTLQFSVTGKLSDSSTAPVTATYSATGGTITSGGLYTAGQTGGAFRAIATSSGKADTSTITVIRPSVASVVMTPVLDTVAVGQTRQLSAVPKDSVNNVLTGRVCTWTSGNPAVATVNGNGLVTAQTPGSVTITATCEGINGVSNLTIIVVLAATVQITPSPAAVSQGATTALAATARDKNGAVLSGHPVTWTSLSPTTATVGASGVVTGVSVGTAMIRASVDTASTTSTVRVDTFTIAQPWLLEDFSTYLGTPIFLADPRGIYVKAEDVDFASNGQIDLTVGLSINGFGLAQSLRYDYPDRTGSGGRCADYSVGRNLTLPSSVPELWAEFYVRFSSNFTTVAPGGWGCSSNPDLKFIFGRSDAPSGLRWEVKVGNSVNQTWILSYPQVGGAASEQFPFGGNGGSPPAPFDGAWHRFRVHWKCGGSGTVEFWLDGSKLVNHVGDLNAACGSIYGLALGRNLNQGPDHLQSVWWGRIAVWKTNPGW